MSQLLCIGRSQRERSFYDCVLEDMVGAEEKLKMEWLSMDGGCFSGPWKVTINDKSLFRKCEPLIRSLFESIGLEYPDDVWVFFEAGRSIEHPTQEELDAWIIQR